MWIPCSPDKSARLWAADVQLILRPRATGRMEFSARLVPSSNSGYSKKRVSFFHKCERVPAGLAQCAGRQCNGLRCIQALSGVCPAHIGVCPVLPGAVQR